MFWPYVIIRLGFVYIMALLYLFLDGMSLHIISALDQINKKVDNLMRAVSIISSENNPSPELPDSVKFPIENLEELDYMEKMLTEDRPTKDAIVSKRHFHWQLWHELAHVIVVVMK